MQSHSMQMPENTIITVDNIGFKMCKVDSVLATKMNTVFLHISSDFTQLDCSTLKNIKISHNFSFFIQIRPLYNEYNFCYSCIQSRQSVKLFIMTSEKIIVQSTLKLGLAYVPFQVILYSILLFFWNFFSLDVSYL